MKLGCIARAAKSLGDAMSCPRFDARVNADDAYRMPALERVWRTRMALREPGPVAVNGCPQFAPRLQERLRVEGRLQQLGSGASMLARRVE